MLQYGLEATGTRIMPERMHIDSVLVITVTVRGGRQKFRSAGLSKGTKVLASKYT